MHKIWSGYIRSRRPDNDTFPSIRIRYAQRGQAREWSDIDLIVVSPRFDDIEGRSFINLLWRIAARVDSRIEPLACGSRQWREDDSSAILEIARREGEVLEAA